MSSALQKNQFALKDILWLVAIFGLFYWGLAWIRPLANPDEGRYVEIPREMVATGNWLTPKLNGVYYFEKPPLFYWMQAIALKAGGVSDWVGRFWNCTLGILGIVGTYLVGCKLYGRREGVIAGIVLGSSLLYFAMAHVITIDMALSFFMAGTLALGLLGLQSAPNSRMRRYYFIAFYVFMAAATLTKGLIGILIPGAILFLWMLFLSRWKQLRHMYIPMGLVIGLALALPWHVLATMAVPEFFDFYVIREQFLRFFTDVHSRTQPVGFSLLSWAVGAFPWILFLPQSVRYALGAKVTWERLKKHPVTFFLLIWALFIPGFFSISKSQLVPYVLPAVFPVALLVAPYLAQAWSKQSLTLKKGYCAFGFLLVALALAAPVAFIFEKDWTPLALTYLGSAMATGFVGGTFLLCLAAKKPRSRKGLAIILAVMAIVGMLTNPFIKEVRTSSTKSLALFLKPHLEDSDQVYHVYNYFNDLPVYLESLTYVVGEPGEHAFGLSLEDHSDRYIEGGLFSQRWNDEDGGRLFAVFKTKDSDNILPMMDPDMTYKWFSNKEYTLVSNRPLPDSRLAFEQ